MFYNVVVNGDETTYVPTTLGNVLLLVIVAILLAGAVICAKKYAASRNLDFPKGDVKSGRLTARQLAFCAMSIALGTILSKIKLIDFPWGGSCTLLSMLAICLPGYFFGLGAGLMTGVAHGVLQILIDPYVLYPAQLVLDYLLAFGALGLSGLFTNAKRGLIKGYLAAVLGRYVFVVLSGVIFFAAYAWDGWAPLPYSLVYNGIYIFAEAAITVAILAIPSVNKGLSAVKKMTFS